MSKINDKLLEKLNLKEYIQASDRCLSEMQFTEHNLAHLSRVVEMSTLILESLNYDEHTIELAELAGYMHDIGNVINRHNHGHLSAILVHKILLEHGYELEDVLSVMSAVGNHDENTGTPVNEISAALIIADKSDVRRSRVRKRDINSFDIHDRVNYSVYSSTLYIDTDKSIITLKLVLDTQYSSIVEFFNIFSERMKMCKEASNYLGLRFKLIINEIELLN